MELVVERSPSSSGRRVDPPSAAAEPLARPVAASGRRPDPAADSDPEGLRRLWRAVIVQALRDAAGRAGQGAGDPRHLQQEALTWLLDSRVDFQAVCALAGLSAAVVRRAAVQAVARTVVAKAGRRRRLLDRLTRPNPSSAILPPPPDYVRAGLVHQAQRLEGAP